MSTRTFFLTAYGLLLPFTLVALWFQHGYFAFLGGLICALCTAALIVHTVKDGKP